MGSFLGRWASSWGEGRLPVSLSLVRFECARRACGCGCSDSLGQRRSIAEVKSLAIYNDPDGGFRKYGGNFLRGRCMCKCKVSPFHCAHSNRWVPKWVLS